MNRSHNDPIFIDELKRRLASVDNPINLTKLERRITAYLSANPNAIAVDNSATLAKRAHVSPMTVTRFFKKVGFENAADAKDMAKRQLYEASPEAVGARFETFRRTPGRLDQDTQLAHATEAMRKAVDFRSQPLWKHIVQRVSRADSVYAAGFQTMRYLANGLVQRLNYIRPNAFELDGIDGTYAQLLTNPRPGKVLIIIDTFRYGRNGPRLAQAAQEQGAEVVVFCDELCDWAHQITPHVVALPMEPDLFLWPSTALHFSLNLLVQDVIDDLGDDVTAHLKQLSKAQDTFGHYAK
ncbi:MurR/RpiR family transcriptional regulator [Hydrogenophaga sp. PAMC20947]|uniref:MurR/RpiR family transcriptional regulator n=1 Tax=Hydrogenophaga sp. PAMC20947 TaxID=2565558 RepID=UPI00109D9E01|nr:MurR/RpiR family transcriptional regulator [Hydrogenophaga sp. PAMC20947]QCB46190.1 MurR/RpiR family transcriptional regulator [Hydrogenophaga sp. PAMC20947]